MKGIAPLARELCNIFQGQVRRKIIRTLMETWKWTDMPLCNSFSFALQWLIHGVDGSQYRQVLIKSMFATTSCQRQFLKWSSRPTSAWRIRRCPRGATQSQNEAFNAMIWNMWPKHGFAGAEVVELSAHLAAAHFIHHEAVTFLAVLRKMECTTGSFSESYVQLEGAERVRKAEVKAGEKQKYRRKTLKKEKERFWGERSGSRWPNLWTWCLLTTIAVSDICVFAAQMLFGGVRLTPCTITFQPYIVDP